jgi:hypothetical protein
MSIQPTASVSSTLSTSATRTTAPASGDCPPPVAGWARVPAFGLKREGESEQDEPDAEIQEEMADRFLERTAALA